MKEKCRSHHSHKRLLLLHGAHLAARLLLRVVEGPPVEPRHRLAQPHRVQHPQEMLQAHKVHPAAAGAFHPARLNDGDAHARRAPPELAAVGRPGRSPRPARAHAAERVLAGLA